MFSTPPLFAFGFANLAMLGWLAAAAAPVLIHLWNRRKYREMPWAAMQYLLAALRRNRRRLLLEQWLLLAIRTLLIVLLVLAVAEPYLQRSIFSFVAGQRTHRVLVIDGSYSMAYRPTDKSRFERAKEVAAQIVTQSPPGDGFTLLLMAAPPRLAVARPAFAAGEILQELDALQLAQTSADLPATLALVEQVLLTAKRENRGLARSEVIFLTDLGRVGWTPDARSAAAAESRRRAASVAGSATLSIVDLGQPAAENLAVTRLRPAESLATLGRSVQFQAEVRNFGAAGQPRRSVDLLVDGHRAQQQYVDIPPGGSVSVGFTYRFDTPGDHAVEARVEGDRLDLDNHRYLALTVRESLRVLCVDGRPSADALHASADYLRLALAPRTNQPERVPIRPEVVPEGGLLERELGPYDCVFLSNVAQFTPSEAKALDAYLASGGSVIFFLGDQVLAERYNRELGGQAGTARLLPARLGAVRTNAEFRVNPLEYRHPAVQVFRGRERAGLLTTPVSKYFQLEVPKDSPARVVLALPNGDPLIVEESIRHGHVVLVATSADISWAAMPMWPSFLPLVQELVAYCVGGQLAGRNVEVGQALEGSVPAAAQTPLSIRRPDESSESLRLHLEGDYGRWSYSETTASGIYAAQFGAPLDRRQLFAVNLDTSESDLAQLSLDELRNEVWPKIPFRYQTTWQNPERPPGEPIGRGTLHLGLLYAALGLLFVETFLAWRLGHHES